MAKPYAGPSSSELRPDTDAMWAWLSWWFHECNRGLIEIGWMNPTTGGLTQFRRFELEDESILGYVEQINRRPGQSVYVRASTVAGDAPYGRTEDIHILQAGGVWVDLDTQEQVTAAKQVSSILRPNGWVITGRHPHPRYQLYFRSSEPLTHPETIRGFNQRLLSLYGGDPAVVNPSRLMRLPGTIAWPFKEGRIPEMTFFEEAPSDRPRAYPISTLVSQLPAAPAQPEVARAAQADATASSTILGLTTARTLIAEIQGGRQWHNNMIRLVGHWISRGWSDAEILLASESLTLPGWTIQQTRAEVAKAIHGARTKWNQPEIEFPVGEDSKPFPDHVLDPWDNLKPPAFPYEAVPEVIQGFVEERSKVMGADPCAMAWSCISAASAALDGRFRLKLKRHDNWSVPPPVWVALIGSSGSKKTPMVNEAWHPIDACQRRSLAAYAVELRRWKALPKDEREAENEPPPPIRLITHDSTVEGLQEILSHQDRGIGVLRDELAGFIASMDKYTSGRGGSDRAFWLQSYNGGSYVADRVKRGTTVIDNLLVTVCGGIQPEKLASFTDLTDDGLWQRFVPIIVGQSAMGTDEPPGPAVARYHGVMEELVGAPYRGDITTLSEGAHEIRAEMERAIFALEQVAPISAQFASFCGKLAGLFGRLSLVFSYLNPAGPGMGYIVSEKAARQAATLIKQCVIPHAAKVYAAMGGQDSVMETVRSIAGYLLVKRLDRITASDLTRNVRACRGASLPKLVEMVSPLLTGGWLNPENNTPGNKAWLVNPGVRSAFEQRAIIETQRREAVRNLIVRDDDQD